MRVAGPILVSFCDGFVEFRVFVHGQSTSSSTSLRSLLIQHQHYGKFFGALTFSYHLFEMLSISRTSFWTRLCCSMFETVGLSPNNDHGSFLEGSVWPKPGGRVVRKTPCRHVFLPQRPNDVVLQDTKLLIRASALMPGRSWPHSQNKYSKFT